MTAGLRRERERKGGGGVEGRGGAPDGGQSGAAAVGFFNCFFIGKIWGEKLRGGLIRRPAALLLSWPSCSPWTPSKRAPINF